MTEPETSSTKPRPHKDRVEVTFDHFAVRTSDTITQYPQATGYEIDEDDNLILTGEPTDGPAGNRLALIRSREWEAIYYPGATRVMESFFARFFDANGNEVDPPKED